MCRHKILHLKCQKQFSLTNKTIRDTKMHHLLCDGRRNGPGPGWTISPKALCKMFVIGQKLVGVFYAEMRSDGKVDILFQLVRFHRLAFVSASKMNTFEECLSDTIDYKNIYKDSCCLCNGGRYLKKMCTTLSVIGYFTYELFRAWCILQWKGPLRFKTVKIRSRELHPASFFMQETSWSSHY